MRDRRARRAAAVVLRPAAPGVRPGQRGRRRAHRGGHRRAGALGRRRRVRGRGRRARRLGQVVSQAERGGVRPMPANVGLAQLSNAFLVAALLSYSLAVLAFAGDFAFGRRRGAAAAGRTHARVPELVGAGAGAAETAAETAAAGDAAPGARPPPGPPPGDRPAPLPPGTGRPAARTRPGPAARTPRR